MAVQLRIDARPRERSQWSEFELLYDSEGGLRPGSFAVIDGETWVYGTDWQRAIGGNAKDAT